MSEYGFMHDTTPDSGRSNDAATTEDSSECESEYDIFSDCWYDSGIRHEEELGNGVRPEEMEALKHYLRGTTSVEEAAFAITRSVEADKDRHDNIETFWHMFISGMMELPQSETPRLIRLLAAIRRLPSRHASDPLEAAAASLAPDSPEAPDAAEVSESPPAPESSLEASLAANLPDVPTAPAAPETREAADAPDAPGAPEAPEAEKPGQACVERHIWRDLDWFGWTWLEHIHQRCWRDHLRDDNLYPGEREERRLTHIRQARVTALILVAGLDVWDVDEAYDYVAEALEDSEAAAHDFAIPALAEWMSIAGTMMYAGAVDGRETWAFSIERSRKYDGESKAMTRGRWDFWKRRLEEVATEQGQPHFVRDAAQRALGSMKTAESSVVVQGKV